MEDKCPTGSEEIIRRFVKKQERWAMTWLSLIALNMAEAIYYAAMLGLEGFTWWRVFLVILFGLFAGVDAVCYGETREKIILGKIMNVNGVSVKIDEDGNIVGEVHMEKAESQEE